MVSNKYNIIGIGNAGCALASLFLPYPQYNVFRINTAGKGKKFYKLSTFKTMEEYENNVPNLKQYFKLIKGKTIVLLGGGNKISGCLLGVLEQIKHCDISILYIKPEMEFLDDNKLLCHNVVYNVIQEYARSGVFREVFIVQNSQIEGLFEEITFKNYFTKINEYIFYIVHTINCFDNTEPIINNFLTPLETARIETFIVMDLDTKTEILFFPLDSIREKRYYFGVNEKQAENDNNLFSSIKNKVKEKKIGDMKVSYSLYSVDYEKNIAIGIARSSQIQK